MKSNNLMDLISVYFAQGRLEGEMIKIFLEANGIEAILTQEPAAAVYGISIGEMGIVEVLVSPEKEQEARVLLNDMENGKFLPDNSEDDQLT